MYNKTTQEIWCNGYVLQSVSIIIHIYRVHMPPGKSGIFFLENSRTRKVLENYFGGLGKSGKLRLTVLEKYPRKLNCLYNHCMYMETIRCK